MDYYAHSFRVELLYGDTANNLQSYGYAAKEG
jgi:hypothetical protein